MRYKISELCNIISGGTPKTTVSKFWNGNIPWISIKDFTNSSRFIVKTEKLITEEGLFKSATNLLDNSDLIISARGTVGKVAIIKSKMAFNQSCYGLRVNLEILLPYYLFYWLQANANKIKASTHGSVFDTITKETFSNIEINLPEYSMQQHIVDTIGSVDDLIEKYEKYYSMINEYLNFVFDTYETSSSAVFSDVFSTFNGGTFKSKEYLPFSNLKLITIKNINDDGFSSDNTSFLNPFIVDKKHLLNLGDILLTMTGNLGRVGIVDDYNCYLNQRVLKLTCDSKLYLFLYLKKYKDKIIQLGKGTAQQNLSLQDLNNLKIKNSIDEVLNFSKNDFYFELLTNLKIRIKKLKIIRINLLKKYFD